MKLNHKDVWSFVYRGISAEIVHWGISEHNPKGIWNLYLYIRPENIGNEELRNNFLPKLRKVDWGGKDNYIYDSYSCPIINELELHGGPTYLNIETYNNKQYLKVGSNYNHLYDNCFEWDQEILAQHGKNSIDILHGLTEILVFCRGHGGYYAESDGEYLNEDKNNFYSFEYKNKKMKQN